MIYLAAAVAIVIALMGAHNYYLSKRVDGLKESVAAEQARVQRFVDAEKALKGKLAEQDSAVAAMLADAAARQKESADLVAKAEAKAATLAAREREIMAQVRSGDLCKDLSGLLRSPPPR